MSATGNFVSRKTLSVFEIVYVDQVVLVQLIGIAINIQVSSEKREEMVTYVVSLTTRTQTPSSVFT